MPTIESLEIRIKDSASQAANGIDILRSSIEKLKAITKGGVGLASVANSLKKLNTEMQNFKPMKQSDFKSLSESMEAIAKVKGSSLSSNISALARIPKVTESLDSSTLDQFASKINKIVDALKPLGSELSSINGTIVLLPKNVQAIANIYEKTANSEKKFFSIENLKNYFSLGEKILNYAKKIDDTFVDLVDISGKYTENLNLFSVALGKFAKAEKEFAEQSEDLLGIDASEFMRYEAVFMNMTRGFGVASDKAALMSRNLVQLGYDLSSLYNVQFDTAMEKLESAISGQPRPMREWGFDLSEATLKAKALELGITKNVESMNQAEKSLIRYVQLMDTAEKIGAKGDFAKTITTTANQMRVLSESWNLFVRSVGNVLVPIANQLLPYLIAAAKAARYVADAIASLAGFELPKVEDFEIDIDMGAEDLEDQLEGADSAAKKLKKTLMGFDELNVLPDQSSGSGSGSGLIGGVSFDIELPSYNFLEGAIESQADKTFKAWKPTLDWFIDNLDSIKREATIIGGIIAAWTVGTKINTLISGTKKFKGLSDDAKTSWSKTLDMIKNVALGLSISIAGMTFTYDAGYVAGEGKNNFVNTVKGVLGALASAAGGAWIGFKTSGSPYGAIAGGVIGLGAGIYFNLKGQFEGNKQAIIDAYWASETGQYVKTLVDGSAEILNQSAELKVKIKTSMETVFETPELEKLDKAQKLIAKIFELDSKENKTAVEIKIIQGLITELNELNIDELKDQFKNTETSYVLPLKEAISATIDELLRQYKIEALKDKYIELYTEQYDAQKRVLEATTNYNALSEEQKRIEDNLAAATNKHSSAIKTRELFIERYLGPGKDYRDLNDSQKKSLDELNATIRDSAEAMKTERIKLEEIKPKVKDAKKAVDEATSANDLLSNSLETIASDMGELMNVTNNDVPDATEKVYNYTSSFSGLEDGKSKLKNVDDWLQQVAKHSKELKDSTSGVNDYVRAMQGLADAYKKLPTRFETYTADGTIAASQGRASRSQASMTYMVPRYAGGGYPGDLFIANDGGPEMVGRIGSRTAVVNNDQIVSAVSQGVYAAVKEAFSDSGSSRGGDTVVQIDGREVFRAVVNQNNSVIRSTGNSPLL